MRNRIDGKGTYHDQITDDHLFMEQGTVATIAPEVGGGTGRRSAGPRQPGPCSRWAAETHNFVRFAREFKKRPRGERVDDHKRDWKGCAEKPNMEAIRRDIGSYWAVRREDSLGPLVDN